VLKSIRNADATAHLPVLVLTAKHITREELKFLVRNNVHELIQKGDVNRAELLQAVRNLFDPAAGKAAVKPPQAPNRKPVVLVVEDNPDSLLTAKALLARDYTILEAMDGRMGVELARQHVPDLILMDIALPEMDGVQAFHAIRQNPYLQHIPVIALTASVMTHDREAVLAHGFNAFIAKPIEDQVFYETIQQVLYGK
jgi:CheY-like chemotaxis protein